jgi:type III pantothenate kinase
MPSTKTLCFDFGNTRLKVAVFAGELIKEIIVLQDDSVSTIHQLLDTFAPQKTILSSVINHNTDIEKLFGERSIFHKLTHLTKVNFTTPVGAPQSIGADRLALSAAAVHFFPMQNNLVISLGSCITTNFINQQHQFIGGSISPGMEMRFKSLNVFTAKLPQVDPIWNYPLLGYDTATNILSGVLNGISFEIDGFIDAFEAKYKNFNIILTGGNTEHFAQRLKSRIFADNNFLFKGLYALSEINNV